MKKTHTLLNRHQLLDPVALRNWLAHNLDPVARADQLLTLRPEEQTFVQLLHKQAALTVK